MSGGRGTVILDPTPRVLTHCGDPTPTTTIRPFTSGCPYRDGRGGTGEGTSTSVTGKGHPSGGNDSEPFRRSTRKRVVSFRFGFRRLSELVVLVYKRPKPGPTHKPEE